MKQEQSNVIRKRILIRCDGAPTIGFGHVVRCLALADELRDAFGCEVAFAMLQGPQGIEQVQKHGYAVIQSSTDGSEVTDEGAWLQALVRDLGVHVLVLDVRTELPVGTIRQIRAQGILIVTIDDPSDRRLVSDFAFYPPVPQVRKLDWSGYNGKRFVGWEWVVLRSQFASLAKKKISRVPRSFSELSCLDRPLTLLVSMGGSDPAGLTLMALEAIEMLDDDLHVLVALGCGFMHETALADLLFASKRSYEIRRDVSNMASLMAEADLSIASFGVTTYELAAIGVPMICVCLTKDHAEAARALVSEHAAISMGYYKEISSANLANMLKCVIQGDCASRMFARVSQIIDGLGAKRIASVISSHF